MLVKLDLIVKKYVRIHGMESTAFQNVTVVKVGAILQTDVMVFFYSISFILKKIIDLHTWNVYEIYSYVILIFSEWTTQVSVAEHLTTLSRAEGSNGKIYFLFSFENTQLFV